jgi:hypothetical protein
LKQGIKYLFEAVKDERHNTSGSLGDPEYTIQAVEAGDISISTCPKRTKQQAYNSISPYHLKEAVIHLFYNPERS